MLKIRNNNLLLKSYLNKSKYNTLTKYLVILTDIIDKNLIIYLTKNIKYKLSLTSFIMLIAATKNLNIFFHLLDSLGNELLFYSIGSLRLDKKSNQRTEVLKIYLKKITNNLDKLKSKPVTAHVLNVNNSLSWFFSKFANIAVLVNINLIYNFSYNGCRKKKQ